LHLPFICRFGKDWAEEIARLLPNGRIVLIPGVAHTHEFTAPEQLATVTKQFLEEERRQSMADAEN
jgi:pimeloyl-ACP methyl ester carboxylesterase